MDRQGGGTRSWSSRARRRPRRGRPRGRGSNPAGWAGCCAWGRSCRGRWAVEGGACGDDCGSRLAVFSATTPPSQARGLRGTGEGLTIHGDRYPPPPPLPGHRAQVPARSSRSSPVHLVPRPSISFLARPSRSSPVHLVPRPSISFLARPSRSPALDLVRLRNEIDLWGTRSTAVVESSVGHDGRQPHSPSPTTPTMPAALTKPDHTNHARRTHQARPGACRWARGSEVENDRFRAVVP